MTNKFQQSFCVDFDSGLALPATMPFRHKQGHLRVDANVTVAAVLDYQTRDGSLISVLRHPDQIFHPRSLESLTGLPITISHPLENDSYVDVTPDNFRKYGHGVTGDEIEAIELTSPYVRIKGLNFQTKEALTALDNGNKELSPGYYISRVNESGVYDNRAYSHRQYGINIDSGEAQDWITYNHLALMDVGENGRSGKGVKVLNLDSAEVLISTGVKTEPHRKVFDLGSKQSKGKSKKMTTTKTIQFPIVNDKGITVNHNFEVDAADDIVISATQFSDILGMLSEAQLQLESLNSANVLNTELLAPTGFDSLKAVVDSHEVLKGENAALKAEIAKKPTVDSLTTDAFNVKLALVVDAIDLVPEIDKDTLAAMSNRQIQEKIISEWDSTKVAPELSDGVVEGMYSVAKSILRTANKATVDGAEKLANNSEKQSTQNLEADANDRIAANRRNARTRRSKVAV